MPRFKNLFRKYCKTGIKNKENAGEGIRTLELLQDWVLSPAPLTRLGNPCTKTWRYDKNAPAWLQKARASMTPLTLFGCQSEM